jgi:two-component system, OmpR family, catabolic regulation response regulator CreB
MTAPVAVLLVEDDPIIARTLAMSLRYHGFELVTASSIREAERQLEGRAFRVILLDVGLPDGSGLDLCARLRARDERLPILMLTARTDEQTAIESMEGGADDYVRKPYSLGELVARINRLLTRAYSPRQALAFADISIDLQERMVRIGETTLRLGKREFDILATLVEAGRELVSREKIIAAVGDPHEVYDRTIDSHLSHIRSKLKKAGTGVRIVAVYGVGYRLEEG